MTECLVCRELTGGHPVPGGFLWDDEHVAGFVDAVPDAPHGAAEIGALADRLRARV